MKKGSFLLLCGFVLILAALALTGYNLWDSRRAGNASEQALATLTAMIQAEPKPKPALPDTPKMEEQPAAPAQTEAETEPDSSAVPQTQLSSGSPQTGATSGSPQIQQSAVWVPASEIEYPDYTLNPDMDMPVVVVDTIEYDGILTLPTLGMEFPISSEWDYTKLKNVPCRYAGSAYKGNFVICGHNYRSHFGPISRLNYGDEVYFTDLDGNWFRYRVVNTEVLEADAVKEMISDEWDMTLFTCNLQGNARITVRCEKIIE